MFTVIESLLGTTTMHTDHTEAGQIPETMSPGWKCYLITHAYHANHGVKIVRV